VSLIDLFFPPRCFLCDGVLNAYDKEFGVCKSCKSKLPFIKGEKCFKCGKKISKYENEFCGDCKKRTHFFDKGFSLFQYDDLMKSSMYRLKYGGRHEYGETFGRMMAEQFGKALLRADVDAIVPVPIHKTRLKERGYNQAEAIAATLSKCLNVPIYKDYLIRQKNTKPLKLMTPMERQKNLKNAFIIGQNDVKSKVTVVIDDIYTTGSTMDAIAKVLKSSGVKKVYFITVANGEDGGE